MSVWENGNYNCKKAKAFKLLVWNYYFGLK